MTFAEVDVVSNSMDSYPSCTRAVGPIEPEELFNKRRIGSDMILKIH